MKTTFTLCCVIFLSFCASAQINPHLGIFDLDSCDFTANCHLIEINSDSANIWQVGLAQKSFFDTASMNSRSIMTDTVNTYPENNHSYFDFTFSAMGTGAIVSFSHKLESDTNIDGGYISISYDKGLTWNNVLEEANNNNAIEFNSENLYGMNDTLMNGESGFSGTIGDWTRTRIQWIWIFPLRINPDTVMLRFHFISDSLNTNKAGWIIDDFLLSDAVLGGSVGSIEEDNAFTLFPNPSNGMVKLSLESANSESVRIEVLNVDGKLALAMQTQLNAGSANLDLKNLAHGAYFIRLTDNEGKAYHQKLILK